MSIDHCIGCGAPRLETDDGTAWECGSFLTNSGKWIPELATSMCKYVASIVTERDALQRRVKRMGLGEGTTSIGTLQDGRIHELMQQNKHLRAERDVARSDAYGCPGCPHPGGERCTVPRFKNIQAAYDLLMSEVEPLIAERDALRAKIEAIKTIIDSSASHEFSEKALRAALEATND